MSEDSTTQCLLFPEIFRKPVIAQFDQREGSSDGGALLLKAADRRYGLVAGLALCLRDERQAVKVDHSLRELVAQRVFSIAWPLSICAESNVRWCGTGLSWSCAVLRVAQPFDLQLCFPSRLSCFRGVVRGTRAPTHLWTGI